MNFLFGALLLIIILLPGLILRVSYLSTPYGKKTFRFSIVDELILSLIPTLILQGTGYFITNYWIKDVDEKRLYYLFINNEKVFSDPLPDWNIFLFFLYTILLCLIAVLLGVWFRKLVKRNKLDIKYPILRFYNDWHYILRGLILDFPGHQGEAENVDNVWVDVVTISKDDAYIYSGFLKEYVLTKDDGLDRIYLTNVQRRKLSNDGRITYEKDESIFGEPTEEEQNQLQEQHQEEMIDYDIDYDKTSSDKETHKYIEELEKYTDERYYYMPGDYFVIPYSEIKNINITYYKEKLLNDGSAAAMQDYY